MSRIDNTGKSVSSVTFRPLPVVVGKTDAGVLPRYFSPETQWEHVSDDAQSNQIDIKFRQERNTFLLRRVRPRNHKRCSRVAHIKR